MTPAWRGLNSPHPLFLSLVLMVLLVTRAQAAVFQCPMHPWIKSDQPAGKCTICGMNLAEAVQAADPGASASPLVTLTTDSATVIGVQTAVVRRAALVRTLRIPGVIDDDETRRRTVSARAPGRIDKLNPIYLGAEVRAGAVLATIYSREMLVEQRNYANLARVTSFTFTDLERSIANVRLQELGLTEAEITNLENTLIPTAMVSVRAPISGTVVSRTVSEGQYVTGGDRLFEIGDFSSMWCILDAPERELAWLRVGQLAEIAIPSQVGRVFTAPITLIEQNLDEATRTARVRILLPNADRALMRKQAAIGAVRLEVPDRLLAPRTAVLQHTGEALVYVDRGNRTYEPRPVRLGRIGDADAEILSGLQEGERVVTGAALLLDAQAQLARAAGTGAPMVPAKDMPATATPTMDMPTMPTPATATPTMDMPTMPTPAMDTPTMAMPAMDRPAALNYEHLKSLALALTDGAGLLAADDFPSYQKLLPAIRTALEECLKDEPAGPLMKFKGSLSEPAEIKNARRDFEPLSTAVADLARERQLTSREMLHVYQCPMSPVLGKGRWLSRDDKVKNPFFGSAMLECGDEVK